MSKYISCLVSMRLFNLYKLWNKSELNGHVGYCRHKTIISYDSFFYIYKYVTNISSNVLQRCYASTSFIRKYPKNIVIYFYVIYELIISKQPFFCSWYLICGHFGELFSSKIVSAIPWRHYFGGKHTKSNNWFFSWS